MSLPKPSPTTIHACAEHVVECRRRYHYAAKPAEARERGALYLEALEMYFAHAEELAGRDPDRDPDECIRPQLRELLRRETVDARVQS